MHSKTLEDQQELVDNEDSREILEKAKDYSASIVGISDSRSIISECTNSNTLGIDFDFDAILLGSQAYKSAHRSNLRQLIPKTSTTLSNSLSWYIPQRRPIPVVDDMLRESSSALGLSTSGLPLSDNGRDPNHFNENSSLATDQVAKKSGQMPLERSNRVEDEPFRSPGTSQQSITATATAHMAVSTMNSGYMSPREKEAAVAVTSLGSTWAKASVTPKVTLLRLLRKYWHARSTQHYVDSNETGGPLAARPNTESHDSTWTPLEKQGVKVLILGTSESGKSTLLKAIRFHTAAGYNREEHILFAKKTRANIIRGMLIILEAMECLNIPLQHRGSDYFAQILRQAAQVNDEYPEEVAEAVTHLWADAGIQEAFRRRCGYQLLENLPYFASRVQQVIEPGYNPSREDVLRLWTHTEGIWETTLDLDNAIVKVFDMGGNRSQRRKWIHTFKDVDSIVFTVDASAYCRRLFEDESMNRMQEQLRLWDSIANSRWFNKTNFILVFTKVDTLLETIELSPISEYFLEFEEPAESGDKAQVVDSYLAFLKERFLSLVESAEARQRTQVVFADLVHIENRNPGGLVLEKLKARPVTQQ